MYIWMQAAKSQGYINLIVENDSMFLIDMLIESCKLNWNTLILVRRIQDLLKLQRHVIFKHTWHEGNWCADWSASFSLNQSLYDVRIIEVPS